VILNLKVITEDSEGYFFQGGRGSCLAVLFFAWEGQ